jgi:hypothetical protein
MLKLYIYGYLNRVQSSRRLEREAKHDFRYVAEEDIYICPAGEKLATTSRTRKMDWSCAATGPMRAARRVPLGREHEVIAKIPTSTGDRV